MVIHKALIDTNVCLDAAQRRKPFYSNALKIVEAAQYGKFSGFIASHSFDTIFYLLKMDNTNEQIYTILRGFRRAFSVAPVTQQVIDQALDANWNDFEDAIHYQAARTSDCDAIITRNTTDFNESKLPVLSPQQFLDQITGKN